MHACRSTLEDPTALKYLDEPVRHAHRASDGPDHPAPVGALALAYGLIFFCLVMFYMTPVQIPFLLRDRGITSSALAAGPIVIGSLASGGSAMILPRLRRNMGYITVYAFSMLMVAFGYGIIALTHSYAPVLLGAAISGFGVGLIFPNSGLWVTALAPPRLRGRLLGMMTAALYLGQFSSPILVQPAVSAFGLADSFGLFAIVAAVVSVALYVFRVRLEPRMPRRA